MADVKHTEVFNCSPEQFFEILIDYEKYPEFLSEVNKCEVIADHGDHKHVQYEVSVVKKINYVLELREQRPSQVAWDFVKGDLFKKMSGHWKLSEDNGKTKAEYYVDAAFGMFVPKPMIKTVLNANLPAMMKSYHQRVEKLYGGTRG
jgi:ribosome-associated toxin RatA of RatAB toxin-antitoxin module